MRQLIRLTALIALVILAGCDGGHDRGSMAPPSRAATSPSAQIHLTWVPIPPSSSRSITVTGRYPQVDGAAGLALVNDALRSLVVKDSATMQENLGDDAASTSVTYTGGDTFVNDGVVSVLEQAEMETSTGGAGVQEYWVSGTWLLPTAAQLKIDDMFTDPPATWPVLGDLARQALRIGANACTAASVDDSLSVVDWTDPNLYRDFAVAPDGLHLGFSQYAVAEGACGAAKAVIPWNALHARLSPVGGDVIASIGT